MAVLGMTVALIVAPPSGADMLASGSRGVEHQVVIEGMDQFPDLKFALYPTYFSGEGKGWAEVTAGELPYWYKLLSPKLYAWPAADGSPKDSQHFENPSTLRSDLELKRLSAVKVSDPTHSLRSVYRIAGIEGSRILLQLESETRYDAENRAIATPSGAFSPTDGRYRRASVFGLLALVSLAGLFWLRRRLRHPSTLAAPPSPPPA